MGGPIGTFRIKVYSLGTIRAIPKFFSVFSCLFSGVSTPLSEWFPLFLITTYHSLAANSVVIPSLNRSLSVLFSMLSSQGEVATVAVVALNGMDTCSDCHSPSCRSVVWCQRACGSVSLAVTLIAMIGIPLIMTRFVSKSRTTLCLRIQGVPTIIS